MKKAISLALALVLCLGLLPAAAGAAAAEWVEVVPVGKYQKIHPFYEGAAAVQDAAGKWGFINTSGKEFVSCRYKAVEQFSGGRAAVQGSNGKWGFVDTNGKEIIPCQYGSASARSFSEGLALVTDQNGWRFLDPYGKTVIILGNLGEKYGEVIPFCDGFAQVRLLTNGKTGCIDRSGKLVTPCVYGEIENFSDGLAAVTVNYYPNKRWGFIDQTGKLVIPCQYDGMGGLYDVPPEFHEGLAFVRKGSEYSAIDKTGRQVFSLGQYIPLINGGDNGAGYFQEGLAPVKLNNKYGFIDKTGKLAIPAVYDADSFSTYDNLFVDGLAKVCRDKKWGFVDKTGKEIVPCQYDDVNLFEEGLAWVKKDGKYGYVDRSGQLGIPCQYDNVSQFSDGLAVVKQDGKWGFIDQTGKLVIPCKYEGVDSFANGFAKVSTKAGEQFLINHAGEVVSPSYSVVGFSSVPGFFSRALVVWKEETVNGKTVERYGVIALKDSAAPAAPATPTAPAVPTAYASTQTVQLDGQAVSFQMYALKDANGSPTNYVKVRDVALLLNGTKAQFGVGYDGAVNLMPGQPYTPDGSEMKTPFSGDRAYTLPKAATKINGQASDLKAIVLSSDSGGGFTYYKLRDLGKALGFNVGWSKDRGVFIETGKPYGG